MFSLQKKAQSTPLSPTAKLIAVIIMMVAILLIIYFAVNGKLGGLLSSPYT